MNATMTANVDVDQLLDEIQNSKPMATSKVEPRSGSKYIPSAVDPSVASTTKIMIIDDEPINVKVCQKYLNELGYKRCVGLSDATRAIAQIEEEKPDLVILDVMMPVVSGVDILRQIRAKPELSHIPVLILTASTDRNTKLTVLELGASDFLTKPIDPSELAPRVRNVLTVKQHQDNLKNYANTLEAAVQQRTLELEASRQDVIFCLARCGIPR